MDIRDQVEALLPNWERLYPNFCGVASDLGLIKAKVWEPNTLLLSRRHAKVRQRAKDSLREKWRGQTHAAQRRRRHGSGPKRC